MALIIESATAARNPLAGPYAASPVLSDSPEANSSPSAANVGPVDRLISVVGGGLLTVWGLRRLFSLKGLLLTGTGASLLVRGLSGSCSVYQWLGVDTQRSAPRHVRCSTMVRRSAADCYRFWRNLEQAPRFMKAIRSVRVIDERHSHWEMTTPVGSALEWDAIIYEDEPHQRIAWRTLPGAPVGMAGIVTFTDLPDLQSTLVHSELRLGRMGPMMDMAMARLVWLGPDQQMSQDLERFKALMDAGESVPDLIGQYRVSPFVPRERPARLGPIGMRPEDEPDG
jgi:uncharacterized membrane protein